ncbi:aminotransferase-like domain-containing protein [Streptomyces sp. NY05-11A]|uniref:aminotransferase-like domain-containing protein n=1 Tax=Streptomyces soliscabiei TaxID=588897 RepID=UPI0029BB57F3|nr:PLP-dependent aminotransferase family protein [Streptomyces sp. NY05-11A]MDX2680598.1 PLP-dependent aminotransferase family protein [Streptomyces sp. NY05-11A]
MTAVAPAPWPLAVRARHLAPSGIGAVLRLTERPDVLPLAAGSPDPGLFPEAVATRLHALLADSATALQYGDCSGDPELRAYVARRHAARTGSPRHVDHVIATHGSQQGLDLVCRALLDPGDVVVVDRPSYPGALQLLHLYEARVHAVALTSPEGPGELARLARRLPVRLVYTVPHHANPSGISLPLDQRRALAELAERHGFLIVEDDPYADLTFDGPFAEATAPDAIPRPAPGSAAGCHDGGPPLGALTDRVVHLTSVSKTLFPAARLGHLIAPPALAPTFHTLKQATDLGNSVFLQRLAHALLDDPAAHGRHLERARRTYRTRRDALGEALAVFGDALEFDLPDGGFFLWARFTDGTDTGELLRPALAQGVSFVPGAACYPHSQSPDTSALRLSYSQAPVERFAEATDRLRRAHAELTGGGRRW